MGAIGVFGVRHQAAQDGQHGIRHDIADGQGFAQVGDEEMAAASRVKGRRDFTRAKPVTVALDDPGDWAGRVTLP